MHLGRARVKRKTREHVTGVLFCVTHQTPYEDEPNCHCGVLHPPTLRECAEPCPFWRDPPVNRKERP